MRPYVDEIVATADDHTRELGFYAPAIYHDSADRGRLWVAVQSGSRHAAGFLRFGGSDRQLRVFQLFTLEAARRTGVGRRLLCELAHYGEEHSILSVTARVASDLAANAFWQSAGFKVHRTVRGGKTSNRKINIYLRELNVPSLFREASRLEDGPPAPDQALTYRDRPRIQTARYALDLNVVFDALRQRDEGEALEILAAIPVVVTAELVRELERTSAGEEDDRMLRSTRRLPCLPDPPTKELNRLTEELRETMDLTADPTSRRGITDTSDLRHLAACIHYHAYGFVTRDRRILRYSEALRERYGLRVASPADLLPPVNTAADSDTSPVTAALDHSVLSGGALDLDDHAPLAHFFKRLGVGADHMRAVLDPGTTQQPAEHRVVRVGGRHLGVAALLPSPIAGQPRNAHIYVEDGRPESLAAAEHLFDWLLRPRIRETLYRLDLHTAPGQLTTKQVALECGFRRVGSRQDGPSAPFSKIVYGGFVRPRHWRTFSADFEDHTGLRLPASMPSWNELTEEGIRVEPAEGPDDRITLFEFETLVSPGLLLPPGRPGVVVPIRPGFAAQLLPPTAAQTSLLPEREAALRLERAYFFRADRNTLVPRGTIVVFYLSSPRMEAGAVARVTFSATLSKEEAVATLSRQGVLTSDDIDARADAHGRVTAFTFDSLAAVPRPVPYSELRKLNCVGPTNYVEAERISEDQLSRIISAGFEEPGP